MITKKRSNRQTILVLLVLAGVLAYTTFQWGGVVGTGRYQCFIVLGLMGILLSVGRSRDAGSPLPSRVLRCATILLPAYVLFQVIPLPVAMLGVLSPERAGALKALGPVGAKVSFASLSVVPAGTFQYFLLVCAYLVIFLLIRELTCRFRDRRWLVIWPILGIAALEAMLGLWQYFGETGEQIRWGTYANHNHYAGFLEMALPFGVMYPAAVLRRAHSRWQSSTAPALAASGVSVLAVLVFAGIMFSLSRMGFIATFFSLFVMGALVLGTTQIGWVTTSRRRRWVGIGMLAALMLAGFMFLSPERLTQRFGEFITSDGLNSDRRADLSAESIPLFWAYPVFGCGLGEYETASSKFTISDMFLTVDFVHNDYLQLLAELGLVGFSIGTALAFSVVTMGLCGAVNSSDPKARYFAVACIGGLSAIALHSLTDYNLYIPANAMLLAWIAGMTVGSWETTMRARERFAHSNAIMVEEPGVVTLH